MTTMTTGAVTSRDGTAIGYRQVGGGPGLVLLHGAASSGANLTELAEALADTFAVTVPDRRGRGLSGPYREPYSVDSDVEDLAAILEAVGAHDVFGLSSGGIVTLTAALRLPAIRRAVIFEPPLSLGRADATAIVARFDRAMARGRVDAALVTAMKSARMGPAVFNALPDWMLVPLVRMAMSSEDRKPAGEPVSMRAIAPTLHYDFQLVADASERNERFRDLRTPVLLLGGSKSPAYLRAALDELERILPDARRVEIPGIGHAGPWNADLRGSPGLVAAEIRRFLAP